VLAGRDRIEIGEVIEEMTRILLDNGISEDEIRAIIEALTLMLQISPVQALDVIRVPIGRNVIYRGDGVNWTTINMDTTTFIAEDGTVMIPIRFFADALRAPVVWNQETSTSTITFDSTHIQFEVGSAAMYVGGSRYQMVNNQGEAVEAYLRAEHDRLFVPISAVSAAFNMEYSWDPITQVLVFSSQQVTPLYLPTSA